MIKALELAEKEYEAATIVGNYSTHYDWIFDPINRSPSISVLNIDFIEKIGYILIRDHIIANALSDLGVKTLLDIGSDTGHFIAVCSQYNIHAVGIEPNKISCDKVNSKLINKCYNLDINKLISIKEKFNFDCITVLNITHVNWNSYAEDGGRNKNQLIDFICLNSKFAVLSDISGQSRAFKLKGLNLIKSYNTNIIEFKFLALSFKNIRAKTFGVIKKLKFDNNFLNKLVRINNRKNAMEFLEMHKIYKVNANKGFVK